MKRIIVSTIILCLLLTLCACGKQENDSDSGRRKIVTTVFPAYDFARQVAGERAEVTLLVPPGAEVHSFEPTAKDIARVQSCDLFVYNGGESEAWVETLLSGQIEGLETLVMLENVDALEEETVEGMQADEEDEDEAEFDEHVWTSPVNAQRICRALAEKLSTIDPDGRDTYTANAERYCAELAAVDAAYREVVDNAARRTIIVADRFPLRYFTEEYGLSYYAAFPGCAEDTEPSAGTVAFLIDRVREDNIPAVLYIEFSNEKMADVICEDTGCAKYLFHSCHSVTAEQLRQGVSCAELMRANVESLREALS